MFSLSFLLTNIAAPAAAPEATASAGEIEVENSGFSALLAEVQQSSMASDGAQTPLAPMLGIRSEAQLALPAIGNRQPEAGQGGKELPFPSPGMPDQVPMQESVVDEALALPKIVQCAPAAATVASRQVRSPLTDGTETPLVSSKIPAAMHQALHRSARAAELLDQLDLSPEIKLTATESGADICAANPLDLSEPQISPAVIMPLSMPAIQQLVNTNGSAAPSEGRVQSFANADRARWAEASPEPISIGRDTAETAMPFAGDLPEAVRLSANAQRQLATGQGNLLAPLHPAVKAPSVALQVSSVHAATPAIKGVRPSIALPTQNMLQTGNPVIVSAKPKGIRSTAATLLAEPAKSLPAAQILSFSDSASATLGVGPIHGATTPSTPHLADLARVIDSLAAAREALMPAAASMSINHAEFGELSLRFDQRADGGLTVQLSASDAGAHEALKAAVAADRPHSQGSDGNPGTSAQTNQQTTTASSNQAQTRGGSADRGSHGSSAEHRQDQPQRRAGSSRQYASKPAGEQRDGIFA